MHGEAKFSVSVHAAVRTKKLCFYVKYTGVASYTFRSNSREVPAYRGMTMACCCIIEERQQAAQTSDSREVDTSSVDRMAQTPTLCALIFTGFYIVDFSYLQILFKFADAGHCSRHIH